MWGCEYEIWESSHQIRQIVLWQHRNYRHKTHQEILAKPSWSEWREWVLSKSTHVSLICCQRCPQKPRITILELFSHHWRPWARASSYVNGSILSNLDDFLPSVVRPLPSPPPPANWQVPLVKVVAVVPYVAAWCWCLISQTVSVSLSLYSWG